MIEVFQKLEFTYALCEGMIDAFKEKSINMENLEEAQKRVELIRDNIADSVKMMRGNILIWGHGTQANGLPHATDSTSSDLAVIQYRMGEVEKKLTEYQKENEGYKKYIDVGQTQIYQEIRNIKDSIKTI